jgi:hypothetical protein
MTDTEHQQTYQVFVQPYAPNEPDVLEDLLMEELLLARIDLGTNCRGKIVWERIDP